MPTAQLRQVPRSTGSDYPRVEAACPISDLVRRGETLDDKRLAFEVAERLRACKNASAHEREYVWPRNLLMVYEEDQWLKYNSWGRRWLRKPADRREKRYSVNLLEGRTRANAAKLTQARPSWTCVPPTTDLADHKAAKLGERVLSFRYRDLNVQRARFFATLDCLIFGLGILEVGHDPNGGRVEVEYDVERDESGDPKLTKLGTPVYKLRKGRPVARPYRKGSRFVRALSPFHLFTPPGVEAPDLELCDYLIRIAFVSEMDVRRMVPDLPADFDFGDPDPEYDHLQSITQYLSRQVASDPATKKDTGEHLLVEYIERATDVEGWERGKHVLVVNGKFVGSRESQFEDGRYPFVLLPWMPRRGQFLPQAAVTVQVQPQVRINQTVSNLMTHLALFGLPNILVPKGSGLPPAISFQGGRYDYNPSAGPPTFWSPPAANPSLLAMLDRAVRDLDSAGHNFAFSRGEPVQGVPSALYVAYMQDADAQEIGPVVREHARAFEQLGESLLELERTYADEQELLSVVGRSNRCELHAFVGADLPRGLRVVVQESSMLATSPSARVEQVRGMVKDGFFGPPGQIPPEWRTALLEFIRMPDLLDMETGESLLQRFVTDLLYRLVELGEDVPLDPLWKPPVLQAIAQGLVERVLREDRARWDAETAERVQGFAGAVEQAIAAHMQQVEAEGDRIAMKQVKQAALLEAAKSRGRASERVVGAIAQAAGKTFTEAALGGPPPAQEAPPNGDGGGAPAPAQETTTA